MSLVVTVYFLRYRRFNTCTVNPKFSIWKPTKPWRQGYHPSEFCVLGQRSQSLSWCRLSVGVSSFWSTEQNNRVSYSTVACWTAWCVRENDDYEATLSIRIIIVVLWITFHTLWNGSWLDDMAHNRQRMISCFCLFVCLSLWIYTLNH